MITTTIKRGSEIKVGDYLDLIGAGTSQVKVLTPYTGPLLDLLGAGTQIAGFHGTRIEMTLVANSFYAVEA